MLKEEEYGHFVRGDVRESAAMKSRAPLSPGETSLEERYRGMAGQITALGRERGELLSKKSLA